MKTLKSLLILMILTASFNAFSQEKSVELLNSELVNDKGLNMYVIERNIPGAGNLTTEELQAISQTSCGVLDSMGSGIKWLHSYVTGDKVYCIYMAKNEDLVREHAKKGGFPANSVAPVKVIIDPSTATVKK
ncbi:DUF4242 domain-containing protein [Mangrovimonas sp. TPBH4]|uniref:DUF4242 domain-containing protein n=1 Tax=Mangrovimonas sp. TPBH4 TaxID=1645914 RepID=UPI0009EA48B9|nr:DUF4242 domain-containing protein [Mangrovimonas sp. TPBH4]